MLGKNTEEVKKNFLSTDEEFMGECEKPGVHIFDVFSSWAGSCEAMSLVLKKLKTENGDLVSFAKVQCDQISDLSIYRNKSRPTFLIYAAGVLVKEVKGANTPLLEKYVKEEVNIEKTGGVHVPLNETEGNRSSIKARTINNRQGSSLKHVFYNEREERTLAILKPDIVSENKVDDVKRYIYKNGFQIVQQQEVLLTPERVAEFFKDHENQPYFQSLVNYMSEGPVFAMILSKENAVSAWRTLIGASNPKLAKENDSKCLRGMFGTDTVRNAIHGSKSEEAAKREVKFFFPEDISPIQRTLAIIKPDLVQSGKAAEVVDYIKDHDFKIITMEQVQFTEESATGFYITHRNAPYFANLINWLSSGPVLAMVLEKENAVKEWRDCIGPTNPAMAKELAPECLRARYGANEIQNAVHGSKSVDYASIEIEYIFPHLFSSGNSVSSGSMPEVILPRTFAMIKPDIISSGREEEVLNVIRQKGFNIAAQKKIHLTIDEAKSFYKEHEGKPFYETLTSWISSCSPIIALILEKEDAVQAWRQAIGPTNSIKAKEEAPDSIRAMFGTDGSLNAVHGSDSLESAEREINFFFSTPNGSQPHIFVTQDDISPTTNEVQPVEQLTAGEVITNAENQQTEGAPSENLADQEELKTENTTAAIELEDSKPEAVAPSDVPSNEQPQPESTEQQIQVETQEGKEESQLTENQPSSDVPASEPLVKADVTQEESQNDVEPITQQIDDQKAEGVQQQ